MPSQRASRKVKTKSLQRTLHKSLQKSRRSSGTRRSYRKLELPTLDVVLTYFFNVGAYEIRKKEPAYEPPTTKDFLQEVQSALRSTGSSRSRYQHAGGSNKIQVFTEKIVGATVGTFDTPCNTLMSYFAIVVWAAFFYTLAVSFFQFPTSQLADAFASPVFAMLDLLQGRVGSGMRPMRELKANIQTFVESTLPNIPPMIGSGIQQAILFIFNSEAYKRMVEASLACVFLHLGVASCTERCRGHFISLGP